MGSFRPRAAPRAFFCGRKRAARALQGRPTLQASTRTLPASRSRSHAMAACAGPRRLAAPRARQPVKLGPLPASGREGSPAMQRCGQAAPTAPRAGPRNMPPHGDTCLQHSCQCTRTNARIEHQRRLRAHAPKEGRGMREHVGWCHDHQCLSAGPINVNLLLGFLANGRLPARGVLLFKIY